MLPNFFYSEAILDYNFGPSHPLKPERLRRTIELLGRYGVETIDPGPANPTDILRVHSEEYVAAVHGLSEGDPRIRPYDHGFGPGDNPVFAGMFEAAAAYSSCSAAAANAVCNGADLAFSIGGGLHHARRDRASGFCIFDDPAIACHVLLDQFERVAYVDIDVHHGDGVQWIFYDDPRVLTCSIHEEGRTLFPGTGGLDEVGVEFTSFNVPMQAHTSGDVWLDAFTRTIPRAVETFGAQAVVLQMGTDAHYLDPLAHIECVQQDWLGAVNVIKALGIPIVAVGGGGYEITTVPRMWTSACLTLGEVEYDDRVPEDLGKAWSMPNYADVDVPSRERGRAHAEAVVKWLNDNHIPRLAKP